MNAISVITETDGGGFFAFEHGHEGKPRTLIPDMRDVHVAMEFTAFDETHVRGVLRSRETGVPIPDTAFTARFLVVA